jgi:hypothetical protein
MLFIANLTPEKVRPHSAYFREVASKMKLCDRSVAPKMN